MEDPKPIVRTFRASDTRAALAAVKAALGPQAVILETRTVSRGLLRGQEIEITAAIEPPAPAAPPPLRALPSQAAETPAADVGIARELGALREALAEARRELRRVGSESRAQQALRLAPAAAHVHEDLIEAGIEEALAEELIRQALLEAGPFAGGDVLERGVRALLERRIDVTRPPWLRGGARVIAFVGPTGVGKTTTLAKVAARAVIEARRKVALVTVDTYRVGASDQLARYGEILGAPAFVARDRQELLQAVARCAGADLVLVDTAGRSTSEAVAQQAESIRGIPGLEMHLVLSAAAGPRELAAVADRYRALAPERIVLSKVDEAVAPGCALSALVRLDRPVCAIANGQRVPEDLHGVERADLADLLLGVAPGPRAVAWR